MRKKLARPIAFAACLCLVLAAFLSALDKLDGGSGEKGLERTETAIRRAIAAEYAVTGAYPESLDAIINTYGLQIGDEYVVFYMPVAENLAPELTVLPAGDAGTGGTHG